MVLKTKYSPFCNKVSMFFKNKKKIDNNKLNKTKQKQLIHWRLTKADKLMTKHKKQLLQEIFYYWQYLLLQRNTLDFWIYQFINISQILGKLFVLMKLFWKYNDNFQRKMQMKTKDLKPDTYILICFWTPKLFFLSNDLRNLQATQKTNKIIT